MAKAIIRVEDLPPYAQAYASRIASFGFAWKFVEDQPLASVTNKRVQVRSIGQNAPKRETSKYQQDLRRGDQFPPVIQTQDRYLVDGSTRTEAAANLGWRTFPAFVLDVNYHSAPDSVRRQLIALGAGFNATHGRRMSTANFAEIVDTISAEDDTPKEIARRLHLPEATANTLLNAAKTKHRANRLGINLNGTLTNSHLKLLGGKSVQFTDPVFGGLVSLAQDAHLTIAATTDLTKRLVTTGTERERLALLQAERETYRSVIDGGAVNPTKAARLRQSLGFLNSQTDAEALAELDPYASRVHIQALRTAMEQLERVVVAQERVERSRQTGE
jgi:hypothetical protein